MLGAPRGGAGVNGPPTAGLSERRSRPRGEADERAEAPGSKGGLGGRASVAAGRRVCVCRRSRVVCVCVWTGQQETQRVVSVGLFGSFALSFALPFSFLALALPRRWSARHSFTPPRATPPCSTPPSLPCPNHGRQRPGFPGPAAGPGVQEGRGPGGRWCVVFQEGGGRASGALIEQARAARRAGGAYGRAGRCPTLQPGPGRLIGWLPLARWRASTAPVGGRGARRKERRRAGGRDPRRSPSFLSSRPRRVSPPSLPSLPPSKSFQSSTPPSTASKRGWSCRRPASSTTPTLTPASASR